MEQLRVSIEERHLESQEQFAHNIEHENLANAKKRYYEMQYFAKLIAEIDSLEEVLLGY
jgi:hypothetical protein